MFISEAIKILLVRNPTIRNDSIVSFNKLREYN